MTTCTYCDDPATEQDPHDGSPACSDCHARAVRIYKSSMAGHWAALTNTISSQPWPLQARLNKLARRHADLRLAAIRRYRRRSW